MQKIVVYLKKNAFYFSDCEEVIEDGDLNNTNIINTEKIVFSAKYMKVNAELVGSFLKLVAIKNQITQAVITEFDITTLVLPLLKEIAVIREVTIEEDEPVTYEIVEQLIDNPYIEKINCYYMPEFLLERLSIYYHRTVELRNETFFLSDFMEQNKLKTYSDIYYKKRLIITFPFPKTDYEDLNTFLKINNSLKEVVLKGYSHEFIVTLVKMLPPRMKKLKIIIEQMNSNDTAFLNEISFLKGLEKKYPVDIKILYDKTYKENNFLKQINLQFLKFFCFFFILVGTSYFLFYQYQETEAKQHVENIKEELKTLTGELEEEVEETRPSAYESVLSELKNQNPETIGWLKVENTNIDYPVVHTDDNLFYLNHSFDQKKSVYGWIFADYRNKFDTLSKNTIIYGHNVRGTNLLFGSLKTVLDPSWYLNPTNQVLTFSTGIVDYEGEIFSIYTTPLTNDYLISDFYSDDLFLSYIEKEKERSVYDFGVEVTKDDSILTLSTCYQNAKNRLVVHAKLRKK